MATTKSVPTRGTTIARAIVLGLAAFFVALFVFLLGRRSFHGGGSLTGFLVASAVLALLFASAIFWPPLARLKLLLITGSVVFGLYVVEITLTAIGRPGAKPSAEVAAAPSAADHRSKLEVIGELRAAGVDAWPTVHPQVFLGSGGLPIHGEAAIPLGGISRVRTVYCIESDRWAIFDGDEHGFNNPLGLHRPGEVDVALIGDSFAEGACVQPGEDLASRLRAAPATTRVVSLGNGGDGPLTELATLIEYAAPLRPRVVVWLYYEDNDLLDLELERHEPALVRYLDGGFSAHLVDHQDEIDRALRAFVTREREATSDNEGQHFVGKVVSAIKLSTLRDRLGGISYPEPSPLFARTLQRANETVSGWGGKLYLVYLPAWSRYQKQPANADRAFRGYGRVLEIAAEQSLPVIDFQESLAAAEDPLRNFPGRRAGHYSPEGYARLAALIHARLQADKRLP
ncbi:MAG: SGNH/GDSL hydrolase family protein [Byssovorax sp.]